MLEKMFTIFHRYWSCWGNSRSIHYFCEGWELEGLHDTVTSKICEADMALEAGEGEGGILQLVAGVLWGMCEDTSA